MKKLNLLIATLLVGIFTVSAQTDVRQAFRENPALASSIYTSYHFPTECDTAVPDGYAPFYISHFGRHGSRWHSGAYPYDLALRTFGEADAQGALTELGRDVYERLKVLKEDSEGREGQLSPKGTAEHRGIAERMFAAYPEVFSTADGRRCVIDARSTLVPRCILSMAAFCERLKELNPEIEITRTVGERYMPELAQFRALSANDKDVRRISGEFNARKIRPERLICSLFDGEYARRNLDGAEVARNLYNLAAGIPDVDYLGITLFDIFTDEELYTLWECANVSRYLAMGPSAEFGDGLMADAAPLLKHIIAHADEAIASGEKAAFLRFAHDVNVAPLTGLLEIGGKSARIPSDELDRVADEWQDWNVTPMAANVQFILFRSEHGGEVLVKVLQNERPSRLPLSQELFPYYRWEEFKAYYLPKADALINN